MNAVCVCKYWFNKAECVQYVFDSGYFQYVNEGVFVEHRISACNIQNAIDRVKPEATAVVKSLLYDLQFVSQDDTVAWDAASDRFFDNLKVIQ